MILDDLAVPFFDELNKIAAESSEDVATGRRAALVGGGALAGTTGAGLLTVKNMGDAAEAADNPELTQKLTNLANSEGVEVIQDPFTHGNAYAVDMKRLKKVKGEQLAGMPTLAGEHKKLQEAGDYAKGGSKPIGRVFMGGGTSGGVLAHELGHTRVDKGLGRALQGHAYGVGRNPLIGGAIGAVTGLLPKEFGGDSAAAQHASWAAPLALSAPMLAAEGLASVKGYKALKQVGANKQQLKRYLGQMAPAYGTYLGTAGLNVAAGLGGRLGSRHIKKDLTDSD